MSGHVMVYGNECSNVEHPSFNHVPYNDPDNCTLSVSCPSCELSAGGRMKGTMNHKENASQRRQPCVPSGGLYSIINSWAGKHTVMVLKPRSVITQRQHNPP